MAHPYCLIPALERIWLDSQRRFAKTRGGTDAFFGSHLAEVETKKEKNKIPNICSMKPNSSYLKNSNKNDEKPLRKKRG